MKRPFWFFGYRRSKGHQCVVDGTDCTGADYGDLFDQYHRDPYTMQVKPFKPWTGVLPGKGRQMEELTALSILCCITILWSG